MRCLDVYLQFLYVISLSYCKVYFLLHNFIISVTIPIVIAIRPTMIQQNIIVFVIFYLLNLLPWRFNGSTIIVLTIASCYKYFTQVFTYTERAAVCNLRENMNLFEIFFLNLFKFLRNLTCDCLSFHILHAANWIDKR